ncbi:hypothetical protein MHU86_25490 [Fragilaria crotonensis]|nr:hypothetical protein MHU86_25490 [Fragilaria crotonensis]
MQLKTTDTTTGFSDKDIKSMTKLNFTIPRDFHELARLLENMAGWPSSSSARGPVDAYVGRVVSFPDASSRIDLSDVTTASSRRQLGRLSPRLVHRETHATILGVVRRSGTRGRYQPESARLPFDASATGGRSLRLPRLRLLERQDGVRARCREGGSPSASGGGGARSGRKGQPADAVTNPQQDLFTKDANDVWQVFLDHVRSGPLPNMCCRWHLNGKCVRSCFLSASHVALTTEQTASPSRWSFDHEAAHREFHNRRTTGDAPPFRDSRQPTDGPIAGPSIAIPAAQPRPTATIATHETSLAAATPPRPARPPTTVRRGADRPGTANEDVRLTSRLLTPLGSRTNASSTPPADDAPDRIPLRMDSRGGRSQPGSPPALRAGPGSRGRPTVQRGDTGSEFRSAALLAPLLSAHPLWSRFQRAFQTARIFPPRDFRRRPPRRRPRQPRPWQSQIGPRPRSEVDINAKRRSGKGLATAPTEEAALELEGCEVAPLGMVAQTSIDEKGQTIEKLRLTRPVIQPQRDPRTKRKRQSGHVTTDDRTIWQGFQSTDVPHLVPQTIVAERTHPPHKGGLQIRLQTNTLKGTNRPEVLH